MNISKKNRGLASLCTLTLFICLSFSYGQERTVSGTIRDAEDNQPIPGANVVVKGTSNGAASDFDGNYEIKVSNNQSTLVFSYLGYQPTEVMIGNQSVIDVALKEDLEQLDEVVVIGFGTQRREDVTGAISSVSGKSLNEIPVPSFEQALTGRAAGVQVTSGSGVPGSGASIRVRGIGSTNNSEPLYVIDGIIIGNATGGGQTSISPLALINPNDIENIDILKDASATAIYGARAGNGVVIITTKRGNKGKMTLSYDTFTGFNRIDQGNFRMLSGPEWSQYYSEIQAEFGAQTYPGQPFINKVLAGDSPQQFDWFAEVYDPGSSISHNLSLNAGNEKSQYFTSLNYFNQEGILPNSDLKRYTMRFNSDHRVNDKLKVGNTVLLSRTEANTVGNVDPNNNTQNWIQRLLQENPYRPIFDSSDGDFAGLSAQDPDAERQLDFNNQHVIFNLNENFNREISNRILASVYADWELVKNLEFHTMGSIDWRFENGEQRIPSNTIDGASSFEAERSSLNLRDREERTWFLENTLTYANDFGKHDVTLLAGYQAQNDYRKGFGAGAGAFVNTDYWFFNRPQLTTEITDSDGNVLTVIPTIIPSVSNFENQSAFVSFFGRFIYDYDQRYLLTATVRRDGSSRFGADQRWGTFPAVSAGWRISNEKFMENIESLSNLKLRAGYGISGSDNTGLYQALAEVNTTEGEEYVFNGGVVPGGTIIRLGNAALSWEEIKTFNAGLDIGFYNGRLGFTLDYYVKETDGLLLPFAPALESGAIQNPSGNLGRVSNQGFEFAMNSVNFANPNFSWTTDFNISTVQNEILALPEDADRFNGVNISRVGGEIGALYGFETNGLFQTWDEVYDHAYQNQSIDGFDDAGQAIYTNNTDQITANNNTAPGDIRFVDQNGDGLIDADNDRVVIGSTIPDFTWGLTNTFSYKGFNLSVLLQGVHGVDAYNQLRASQERGVASWENKRSSVLNRWTGQGTSNSIPRAALLDPNSNQGISDQFVEDASFIRVKNVRFSYNIPRNLLNSAGVGDLNANIYLVGTNLFTFTDYTGFDPEIGLRNANNPETAGFDAGQYPLSRQFTLGVQLSF